MSRVRSPSGFTLMELLVVITIILIAFSMIAFLPRGDKRAAAVESAAQELAATLRLARAEAIAKRCMTGVSFNVQNGAGTSGQQINNWSGQHWYRIIGPASAGYQNTEDQKKWAACPVYPMTLWSDETFPNKFSQFLALVENSWIGERHTLKARSVRILAVSDQDNGKSPDMTVSTKFDPTYPRPWCGYYDQATKRLYPWGGYDHGLSIYTAFGYEGADGALAGCVNPADRFTNDSDHFPVFTKGQERPLLNGTWLEYVIRFNPDGSAQEGTYCVKGDWGVQFNILTARYGSRLGNRPNIQDMVNSGVSMPMASYAAFTGFYSITLAPDLEADTTTYPTAQQALQSLTPMFRVQVSPLGIVRVVRVGLTPPKGVVVDNTITNWQSGSQTGTYYQDAVPTHADGTRRTYSATLPKVVPVDTFVFPTLPRQWWMVAP